LEELKKNPAKLGITEYKSLSELIFLNEVYQEKMNEELEIQAHFTALILTALTGKKVKARDLVNLPKKKVEICDYESIIASRRKNV